jgi:checkpoint serine/threonine-protein kinase
MYQELYKLGIGTTCADLYIAWSYYYDAINNFKETEAVFRRGNEISASKHVNFSNCSSVVGLDAFAQPYDELVQAHQNFSLSMSKRLLYDDELSKRQFQSDMEEKRQALTSLRGHKKKYVGSLRTGSVVKSENPGVVNQENIPRNAQQGTSQFAVLEDDRVSNFICQSCNFF